MNYVKTKLKWDEVFIQEALELEEKMDSLDFQSLNQSRLRLCLDQNILSWVKYENWMQSQVNCSSLKRNIDSKSIEKLIQKSASTYESYSQFNFWGDDLVPLDTWDENLIVLGLEPNEQLVEIPNCIFILTPPEILLQFSKRLFSSNESNSETESTSEENSEFNEFNLLDGIDLQAAKPDLQFNSTELTAQLNVTTPVSKADEKTSSAIWDYISDRHDEYSFEARKQFDAYFVLKIENNSTRVFQMDSELKNKSISANKFEWNLSEQNPFKKVLASGVSESFNKSQFPNLDLNLDFKYACITPLKRGTKTVGFLVGLKNNNLAESDQNLLEELAKESA